jgi:hypothetical protein
MAAKAMTLRALVELGAGCNHLSLFDSWLELLHTWSHLGRDTDSFLILTIELCSFCSKLWSSSSLSIGRANNNIHNSL